MPLLALTGSWDAVVRLRTHRFAAPEVKPAIRSIFKFYWGKVTKDDYYEGSNDIRFDCHRDKNKCVFIFSPNVSTYLFYTPMNLHEFLKKAGKCNLVLSFAMFFLLGMLENLGYLGISYYDFIVLQNIPNLS